MFTQNTDRLTLNDLENIDRDWLTPAQVAPVLGADPNYIRGQAHAEPDKLGFPVIVIGTRVKIPRIPFINFMRGGNVAAGGM
jgi:hypothetical protein